MVQKSGFWKKAIRPIITIVIMVVLFTYVSYSWIRREWTPYIEQNNIMITTGGSLMFQFGEENTSGKTINDILGAEFADFKFNPVSNCTGESYDFFTVNNQGAEGTEYYQYIDPKNHTDSKLVGLNHGYLEFDFTLYAPEDELNVTRYVYLEEAYIRDSRENDTDPITKNFAKAIRVSVTFDDKTIIFADIDGAWETENGRQYLSSTAVTNKKDNSDKFIMDGQKFYKENRDENGNLVERTNWDDTENTDTLILQETTLEHFSNYNGGTNKNDHNKALFAISGSDPKTITIRVWVEGTDPACAPAIAGGEIDLLLKFSSFTA